MHYTINELAKLANITKRTLRHYDQIGLLCPARIAENGYRLYTETEVNTLQQILLYKELGMELAQIKSIVNDPHFNPEKTLSAHLSALEQKQYQLQLLIANVTKTIQSLKGECTMTDQEKFEGMKKEVIQQNDSLYRKELNKAYGSACIEEANQKLLSLDEEQWQTKEELEQAIKDYLQQAMQTGNPESELAQKVCTLHKQWLCMHWKDGMYTKEMHRNLADMYIADERFMAYYEAVAKGATQFLQKAIYFYTK